MFRREDVCAASALDGEAQRVIGYGPRSDSSAYSKETRDLAWRRPTTVIGIPIGAPSQRPEPKSACRPVPAPIEEMISAELPATGSVSTRWFQGFVFGKTGQRGAAGRRSAWADEPPSASAHRQSRRMRRLIPLLSTA